MKPINVFSSPWSTTCEELDDAQATNTKSLMAMNTLAERNNRWNKNMSDWTAEPRVLHARDDDHPTLDGASWTCKIKGNSF